MVLSMWSIKNRWLRAAAMLLAGTLLAFLVIAIAAVGALYDGVARFWYVLTTDRFASSVARGWWRAVTLRSTP